MITLNLTMLAYADSDLAVAYLKYLSQSGYRPKKIIILKLISNHKIAKIISKVCGKYIARKLFELYLQVKKTNNPYVKTITQCFSIDISNTQFDYNKYCDNCCSIIVNNLSDRKLHIFLEQEKITTLLFTGGGIVPRSIFNITGIRLIHIHPGFVPDIKGSDGILWSIATRSKLGYSCFYMNAGIDTGDIIYRKEFPIPKFDISNTKINYKNLYDALLQNYDLHLRAMVLVDVIQKHEKNLHDIITIKQNRTDGRTYFFMHNKLKEIIIKKLMNDYV